MSFDVDDVGALCVAHALADRGEVELLATVHDAGVPQGIGGVSVLNRYYNRAALPLGAFKGRFGRTPGGNGWVHGPYLSSLLQRWPAVVQNSSEVHDAVAIYRRVLAAAADGSVVIACIGFPTNLALLLRSPADAHSYLGGMELVALKVRRVVYQGGHFPSRGAVGFNWACGAEFYDHSTLDDGCASATKFAINTMPVEQYFSDKGEHVYAGAPLAACQPDNNPCRAAVRGA